MFSRPSVLTVATAVLLLISTATLAPARADNSFPFGMEMTLDAAPMPGSKRIPDLDIGDNGETVVELWCKGGKGQFSVAGNTVIFVAGPMQERSCPADRAQADDELIAALTEATNWKRQGDSIFFVGPRTLHFRLNTN
jgi:META domain